MGNYVGEIWRRMYKVNISTIPVSRREAEGGGGGGGGGGEGGEGHKVCSRGTTTNKLEYEVLAA